MRNGWFALLIPAAALLAFSATADAHDYGAKHGHKHVYKDSTPAYAYGSRHHAPRHRGYREPHYRGRSQAVYPRYRPSRGKYGHGGYRHGRALHHGKRYRSHGPRHHYSRPYRSSITLHFGY